MVQLAGQCADTLRGRDALGWLYWASFTGTTAIDNPYAPRLSQDWVDVTISKLEQALRAHEARGQPNPKAQEREEGFMASMLGGLKGDGTVAVVGGRVEVVSDRRGVAGGVGEGGAGVRKLRGAPEAGEGGPSGGLP